MIVSLIHLEKVHNEMRSSNFYPQNERLYRLDTVIVDSSFLSATTLDADTPPCDPYTGCHRRALPTEKKCSKKCWTLVDLLMTIEYMKTFDFFRHLSHADKKALIRHVAIMCTHLTVGFFSYDKKSDVTIFPDGSSRRKGIFSEDLELERLTLHGVIQILRGLDIDKNEYVLLKALIVCNPAIEGLSICYTKELEKERLKYSKSLMSYVLSRRGVQKGPEAFTAMMAFIGTLTHMMKRHK
ncbi:hypothetical protein PENTCL1PPCAC_15101, partial [Pristionchus entomophagus]